MNICRSAKLVAVAGSIIAAMTFAAAPANAVAYGPAGTQGSASAVCDTNYHSLTWLTTVSSPYGGGYEKVQPYLYSYNTSKWYPLAAQQGYAQVAFNTGGGQNNLPAGYYAVGFYYAWWINGQWVWSNFDYASHYTQNSMWSLGDTVYGHCQV